MFYTIRQYLGHQHCQFSFGSTHILYVELESADT